MLAPGRNRLFYFYVLTSGAMIGVISILQCFKYGVFGTDLLLGWDSPKYVWLAREVLTRGPFYFVGAISYPHFYVQLLAFLGFVVGNIVVVERVLPYIFTIVLIFANARIAHRITGNVHMAGLAALFTSLSINTLRLYADLNRNLMAFSLSFMSFLLISDFVDQKVINWRSMLSKTYLSIAAAFLVVAGTHLETFFLLALSSILLGILTRSWRKLVALALASVVPIAVLLALFPRTLPFYFSARTYFHGIEPLAGELATIDQILLWSGGSWVLLCFLTAGALYMLYRVLRKKDTLATLILSWTTVIVFLFILTAQRVIPFSALYGSRALLILPIPVLFASAVFALVTLLKDVFLEIGVSSSVRRLAVKVDLKRTCLVFTVSIIVIGSVIVSSQHYDSFLTPYIAKSGYDKIVVASRYLSSNGISKPIVVLYGEHAYWFGSLYDDYLEVEIGEHYTCWGDVIDVLPLASERTRVPPRPLVLITPYLYDMEIPYYLKPYHVGQGVYIIPAYSAVSSEVQYGPTLTVVSGNYMEEVQSEFLYVDADDPSLVVLRVAATGFKSYTFENYPGDWSFFKLEQGGDLSSPEKDPRRFDGTSAVEGNDPAESIRDWSVSQAGAISVSDSLKKEGNAGLMVDGFTDSWGNLGARYNPQGTWDLQGHLSLAVWAKASEKTTFSISLTDVGGNTRTFWDIKPDGESATMQWKRFAVNLNNYTSQSSSFDPSRVDSVDFYVYCNPGKHLSFLVDDPVIDDALTLGRLIYKARVLEEDLIALYFWTRSG